MKFNNGCWIQKEGCACFSPAQVYFTTIEEDRVILCTPTHKINQRGDTLGGVNLTIEITAPRADMIRVKTSHYLGVVEDGPQFELDLEPGHKINAEETQEQVIITSGKAKLVIDKTNWKMTYYGNGEKRCVSGPKDLAYVKTDWKGEAYVKSNDQDMYMKEALAIGVGELIYGMGERFTAFIKNGQSVDIWNEDGGTSTEIGRASCRERVLR